MKYQNKVKVLGKEWKLSITSDLFTKLRTSALYLSIFIMVIMMLTVEVEHDTDEMSSEYSYGNFPLNWVLKLMGLLQLGLSVVCLVVWVILRYPLALSKQKN